jgi:hypothetical protein
MRSRASLVVLVLTLLPALALAQGFPGRRGGMGGGGRRGGGVRRPGDDRTAVVETPAPPLTRIELQRFDPVSALIARKGELALADSEVARLDTIEGRLRAHVEPLMLRVDSLAHDVLAASDSADAGTRSDEGRETLIRVRMALTRTVNQVRASQDSAATEALSTMPADQRARAEALIADQRKQLDDLTRPRRSGGGPARRWPPGGGS